MGSDRAQYERDESVAQRLDRNFSELLQELRVAQMGIQILFAFLLSISFQQRFAKITAFERDVYLATLLCTAVAAALFIAPVAMHRAMFRRHLKDELVSYTSRLAGAGMAFLALSMLGALLLIVDFVEGTTAGVATAAGAAIVFGYLWLVLPLRWRRRSSEPPSGIDGAVP